MEPSNTEIVLVRRPWGYYTDTVGIFQRDKVDLATMQFRRTLSTNQGLVDEYEVLKEN